MGMFVDLFVCLDVQLYLMNHCDDLPQILLGELGRTKGMLIALLNNFELSRLTFKDKV